MLGHASSCTGVRVQLVLLLLGALTTFLIFAPRGLLLESVALGLLMVLVSTGVVGFDVRGVTTSLPKSASQSAKQTIRQPINQPKQKPARFGSTSNSRSEYTDRKI